MHIKGTPKDMQKDPVYNDVVKEVYNYLQDSISIAKKYGIEQIVTDPGICFGKTLEHNIELIRNLSEFRKLGYPVLIGVSRKSFIDKIQKTPVDERLEATIAANTIGIINGANIIRVHDVKENQKASILTDKIFYT
jgi:dihydropteroate synthase